MEESTTYQYILRQGAAREAQKLLLRHGERKWGPTGEEVQAAVRGINDLDRLERMDDALPAVSSWQELLATP
jgi:hypothetical protein